MTALVSFKRTKREDQTARLIADRAVSLLRAHGERVKHQQIWMDIIATHANGNPLRLTELLMADDFNFAHDVIGIREHLDRETGKLKDCFSPRFSKPENVTLIDD